MTVCECERRTGCEEERMTVCEGESWRVTNCPESSGTFTDFFSGNMSHTDW